MSCNSRSNPWLNSLYHFQREFPQSPSSPADPKEPHPRIENNSLTTLDGMPKTRSDPPSMLVTISWIVYFEQMNTTILSQPNTTSIQPSLPPMVSPHSNYHKDIPLKPNPISHQEFGSHLHILTAYYAWSWRCRPTIGSFLNSHQHNLGQSSHLFLP